MTTKPTHIRTTTRRQGKKFTKAERTKVQTVFLATFSNTANIRASCMQAHIDRSTFYQWLNADPEFAEKYAEAEQDANDMIRAEYVRRAVKGVDEPVVSAGRLVYISDGQPLTIKKYSDSLLASLAKVRLPEFNEKILAEPTETASGIAADLLPYLDNEQLGLISELQGKIDEVLDVARAKKLEQEQGIKTLHKRTG